MGQSGSSKQRQTYFEVPFGFVGSLCASNRIMFRHTDKVFKNTLPKKVRKGLGSDALYGKIEAGFDKIKAPSDLWNKYQCQGCCFFMTTIIMSIAPMSLIFGYVDIDIGIDSSLINIAVGVLFVVLFIIDVIIYIQMKQTMKEIGNAVEDSLQEHILRVLNTTYSNEMQLGISPYYGGCGGSQPLWRTLTIQIVTGGGGNYGNSNNNYNAHNYGVEMYNSRDVV